MILLGDSGDLVLVVWGIGFWLRCWLFEVPPARLSAPVTLTLALSRRAGEGTWS